MALFRIMRIYEVAGKDRFEATDRMMEYIVLGVEKDLLVADYIKDLDDPKGKGYKISLKPPKGWMTLFLDQLLGRSEEKR